MRKKLLVLPCGTAASSIRKAPDLLLHQIADLQDVAKGDAMPELLLNPTIKIKSSDDDGPDTLYAIEQWDDEHVCLDAITIAVA
jgi:hypothetical protein